MVVTDHGHLDEGGHGGREPEVTTAWAAAAGPGIDPGGPPLITRQEQVAPLVLRPRLAGARPLILLVTQRAVGGAWLVR